MYTRIQRRFTGQGLYDAHLPVGNEVKVVARDGVIVVTPIKRVRDKNSLPNLVSRISKDYKTEEVD